MPDGYKMPPHFHRADERVEVKQGAFLTIVSVTMMGPYVMTYVRPTDEPWGVFPNGY